MLSPVSTTTICSSLYYMNQTSLISIFILSVFNKEFRISERGNYANHLIDLVLIAFCQQSILESSWGILNKMSISVSFSNSNKYLQWKKHYIKLRVVWKNEINIDLQMCIFFAQWILSKYVTIVFPIKTSQKPLKIFQDSWTKILWHIPWKLWLVIWERKKTERTLQLTYPNDFMSCHSGWENESAIPYVIIWPMQPHAQFPW